MSFKASFAAATALSLMVTGSAVSQATLTVATLNIGDLIDRSNAQGEAI